MAVNRYYSSTAAATTLTSGVTSGASSIAVAATTGFPASTPFTLVLDEGGSSEEIVTVTGASGLSLTVTRGEDGSAAVSHLAGATVRHMLTARDLREPQEHIAATTGVHGVSGALVGTSSTQTLTNKTIDGASNTLVVPQSQVTGLSTSLAGKAATSHTHAEADVTNLTTDLAGKAASVHTHTSSQITDLGNPVSQQTVIFSTPTAYQGTTYASLPGVSFSVAANTNYLIEFSGSYDTTGGSGVFRYQSDPALTLGQISGYGQAYISSSVPGFVWQNSTGQIQAPFSSAQGSAGSGFPVYGKFLFTTTTAGTLAFQFSNAGTGSVRLAYGFFRLVKL